MYWDAGRFDVRVYRERDTREVSGDSLTAATHADMLAVAGARLAGPVAWRSRAPGYRRDPGRSAPGEGARR